MTRRSEGYAELDETARERWSTKFIAHSADLFPGLLGLVVEDVRVDYCRMRMPARRELMQAAGVMHGGAIGALLDAVMVPAVGSILHTRSRYATVDQHIQFIAPIIDEDAIAEGWVVKRGKRTAFCESEVLGATSGRLIAKSVLTYAVSEYTE